MIKKIIIVVISFLMASCTAYQHTSSQVPKHKFDRSGGVFISTSKDGWYEENRYKNSGEMTSRELKKAFSKYAIKTTITNQCHGDDCFNIIDVERFSYYVKPVILHWEDRATEWSGKPDRIEIQVIIYDAVTKEEISNSSFKGKSKWATLGGDHPQDLLLDPISEYVSSLY